MHLASTYRPGQLGKEQSALWQWWNWLPAGWCGNLRFWKSTRDSRDGGWKGHSSIQKAPDLADNWMGHWMQSARKLLSRIPSSCLRELPRLPRGLCFLALPKGSAAWAWGRDVWFTSLGSWAMARKAGLKPFALLLRNIATLPCCHLSHGFSRCKLAVPNWSWYHGVLYQTIDGLNTIIIALKYVEHRWSGLF